MAQEKNHVITYICMKNIANRKSKQVRNFELPLTDWMEQITTFLKFKQLQDQYN